MASVSERPAPSWSIERLRHHFGGIPAERIRLTPAPGTATATDLIYTNDHHDALCELVDGTLVEKTVGAYESILAGLIVHYLHTYLDQYPRGVVVIPDGPLSLLPGLIRLPDVSFISWERYDEEEFEKKAVPDVCPDLAIEVISKSNTKKEMARKIGEYFAGGAQQVWLVYPKKKTIDVYTDPNTKRTVGPDEVLDAGAVLPGFTLDLSELFAPIRRPEKPS
jgi:Uma2 family endonuclease